MYLSLCSDVWAKLEHSLNQLGPKSHGTGLCRERYYFIGILVEGVPEIFALNAAPN